MNGLKIKEYETLIKILKSHEKDIAGVKLFGSRARGDYKKFSDVDLAVKFIRPVYALLISDFEESDLPYTVDIIDYDAVENKALIKNIERDGKLLFISKEVENILTSKDELNLKYENFCRACGKLQKALLKNVDDDDLYLDATIKRFEFCFELSWKLMKAFLEYEGIETNSPRSSIREALKNNIIQNSEAWFDMLAKRNLSAHTYDEETAKEICLNIAQKYSGLFIDLEREIKNRLDAI